MSLRGSVWGRVLRERFMGLMIAGACLLVGLVVRIQSLSKLSVIHAASQTPISMAPNVTYQKIAQIKCSQTPKQANVNPRVRMTMPT
jgi:hypothetical protein